MICKYNKCDNQFNNRSNKSFCSRKCKEKHYQSTNQKQIKRFQDLINKTRRKYTKHKKDVCENCGFIPMHKCQLDVDHIDGNHNNNDILNLQTLCANCHRLKTYLNKDWKKNIN
jgi:hypothetical protein